LTQISRRAFKDKQWVTPALRNSSKSKNALYRKWILSGNKDDEVNCKRYKHIFNKVANKAEIISYRKLFNNKINNSKKMWYNLNRIMSVNYKNKTPSSITKPEVNNQIIVTIMVLVMH